MCTKNISIAKQRIKLRQCYDLLESHHMDILTMERIEVEGYN
jgi:hypothetical protein